MKMLAKLEIPLRITSSILFLFVAFAAISLRAEEGTEKGIDWYFWVGIGDGPLHSFSQSWDEGSGGRLLTYIRDNRMFGIRYFRMKEIDRPQILYDNEFTTISTASFSNSRRTLTHIHFLYGFALPMKLVHFTAAGGGSFLAGSFLRDNQSGTPISIGFPLEIQLTISPRHYLGIGMSAYTVITYPLDILYGLSMMLHVGKMW